MNPYPYEACRIWKVFFVLCVVSSQKRAFEMTPRGNPRPMRLLLLEGSRTEHAQRRLATGLTAPKPPCISVGRSSVAQSVEQLAVNQRVGGSSPSRGAKKREEPLRFFPFFVSRGDENRRAICRFEHADLLKKDLYDVWAGPGAPWAGQTTLPMSACERTRIRLGSSRNLPRYGF